MTGGLLQIVSSGKQDIYLTINPEITFFKKVFRRHTNFALELKEINPEQIPEFNNIVSFNLNIGDAIHRCYLEIELPNLSFTDKYITNKNYNLLKETKIQNYLKQINIWNDYYNNLKEYCDIELKLYRNLSNILLSENITINTLKNEVARFNYIYKSAKDNYKNKIDEIVYNIIDISGYINNINKMITESNTDNKYMYIMRTDIINGINKCYDNMLEYLKYYNIKKIEELNKLNELQKTNQINFNYAKFLGHNFFQYFSLEIGGQQIEKYENDILHINQMHSIKQNDMFNYLEMIGHKPDLYQFNNNPKGGLKILVPLNFWFNKNTGASLPLVALQYTNVIINAKINDIKKIIAFEDYEQMFNDITTVTIDNINGFQLNNNLIYDKYTINVNSKSITYTCKLINAELLRLQFPNLTINEINIILSNNSSSKEINNMTIDKNQWIGFMININNNTIYNTIIPKIASYYPYINFNLYYSLIPNPNVKLICEAVFLDDVERAKFANSKLEYIVEIYNSDIFDIKNKSSFDCELSFNNPCKELLWYIQPQIYLDSFTENGQNLALLFDITKYFNNKAIILQKLTFNQLDVIFNNVDFNYWTNLLSYKFLNNILPNGVYYRSFCLYPEETQPSGTVNLREIKSKQYRMDLNQEFLNEYYSLLKTLYKLTNIIQNKDSILLKFIAKNYNLFIIHNGQARLMFET